MALDTRFNWEKLRAFCVQVLQQAGVQPEGANQVADSLVLGDLRGVDSHGVVRLGIYVERVERGMLDPHGIIEVVSQQDATMVLDAHNNFGAVAGSQALAMALDNVPNHGIFAVGVKGSTHFGIGAYYALQAMAKDKILLVLSNASQTMPPTGGIRPFIGTNPFTVGVPADGDVQFLLDMATSVVARGKIIVAAEKGQAIPEGWAVDKDGAPTTDAAQALAGSVLPVGGPKGYGLSMFVDILSGVLTGAGYGRYVNNMYENWVDAQNVGHIFVVIDIDHFIPVVTFKARMHQYIHEIKSEPTAPGVAEILIPGEIEQRRTLEGKTNGISLPESVAGQLRQLGQRYHVDLEEALLVR